MDTEYQLREFVCSHCGHKVVVHPDLPADYTPTICTPCWNEFVEPENRRRELALMFKLTEFLKLLNDSIEDEDDDDLDDDDTGPR